MTIRQIKLKITKEKNRMNILEDNCESYNIVKERLRKFIEEQFRTLLTESGEEFVKWKETNSKESYLRYKKLNKEMDYLSDELNKLIPVEELINIVAKIK